MIVNICFHGIGVCERERETGEGRYWVTSDLYRRILDKVVDRDDVRLSFDDGNRSDIEVGLPGLVERGLSADFFVLAGRLDDDDSLSRDDVKTLRSAGMTIGSHGWDHVPWRRLGPAQVQRELGDARRALAEASGTAIDLAALPLGRYDAALLRELRPLGYRTIYSSDRYPARKGDWLQARYSVGADDTIDTIEAILRSRRGPRILRNRIASMIKRRR